MSVEEKQTCNMHTKEKEESGTCCQIKDEEEKSVSQLLQEGMELQRRLEDEYIIFSSCIIICIKRLFGRQKMYLHTRWNETLILCMVL